MTPGSRGAFPFLGAGCLLGLLALPGCGSGSGPAPAQAPAAPAPAAAFTFLPAAPAPHQAVQFTDASTGNPASWSWSFGDGGTASVPNPAHAFAAAGTFTVTLTAASAAGSSTATRTVVVAPAGTAPAAAFAFAPAAPAAGQAVTFTDASTGAPAAWSWTFGDGGTSAAQHPLHTFAAPGAYPVTLAASNAWGASTLTRTVTVAPATPPVLGSFRGNIVLGCPTDTSIQAAIYAPDQSGSVYLAWGTAPGVYDRRTAATPLLAGTPLQVALEGLQADARHYYRLYYQAPGEAAPGPTEEWSFHTARPAGSTFTFCLQGDSHPERERTQFNADLYRRTLLTAAADAPDFYLAMGDDFSVDTLNPATVTAAQVTERYTIQRPYLGLVGRSAPVFLVNGNHEQAARYLLNGTPDSVAVWAQNARNAHYAQPAPGAFYSGNPELVPFIGLLRNHYAWTWGDALFVTLDPYWGSPVCVDDPFDGGPKRSNLWDVTHGDAQYQWLKSTLERSTARFKFVFAHHVMGTQRGGIELAGLYEWGGWNGNGAWGFTANRPTWPTPIHQLLAAHGVTVFFQGHDHIWVRQQLDGVTYQTLPEPADPNYALYNADAYLSGDRFPNTGYTRVTVSPSAVKVDYVRTWLPADEGPGRVSGSVAFSYTLQPAAPGAPQAAPGILQSGHGLPPFAGRGGRVPGAAHIGGDDPPRIGPGDPP